MMLKRKLLGSVSVVIATALSSNVVGEALSATDLLNLLVDEGVLSEEKAKIMVEKVRKRQEKDQQLEEQIVQPSDTVRVPYVPNTVKQEIRDAVRQDLRADVTQDVIKHAETERWGIPDALPGWVSKVQVSGDVRVRYQQEFYADDNPIDKLVDLNVANDAGGSLQADPRELRLNTIDDRERLRGRARLMVKAQPTQGFEVGVRLVTGSEGNPVSANQTMGKYGEKWESNFDLAYIKYQSVDKSLKLQGGRFKNPFFHTDLVWDSDMTFEGLAGSWYWNRSDNMFDDFRQWDPYVTVGAFPIKEINQAAIPGDVGPNPNEDDIWLFATQVGTHFDFINQNKLSMSLALYEFQNIQAVNNALIENDEQDIRSSNFFQIGNTLQNIRLSTNPKEEFYGLASAFQVANATFKFDYAGFAPYHIIFTADYIKNLDFDREDILSRIGLDPTSSDPDEIAAYNKFPDRDTGYQAELFIGWPDLDQRDNWNVSLKYRNIEGDAMVASFVDSDFLFGGTNAKGYILEGKYAIDENVWTTFKWISADELDADVLVNVKVDTLQLDINAKF